METGQLNPSITSPRAGGPGRAKSPLDITGRRHAELLRQKAAKDAAKDLDINAVRRAEFLRGWDQGYDAGVQAVIKQLQDDGVIDADEPEASE